MKHAAATSDTRRSGARALKSGIDTRHLGMSLRAVYEGGIDTQPITDAQLELLLRLRQKERDLRRAG